MLESGGQRLARDVSLGNTVGSAEAFLKDQYGEGVELRAIVLESVWEDV